MRFCGKCTRNKIIPRTVSNSQFAGMQGTPTGRTRSRQDEKLHVQVAAKALRERGARKGRDWHALSLCTVRLLARPRRDRPLSRRLIGEPAQLGTRGVKPGERGGASRPRVRVLPLCRLASGGECGLGRRQAVAGSIESSKMVGSGVRHIYPLIPLARNTRIRA